MPFCIFTEMRNFVSANICMFSKIFSLSFKHFNFRENHEILFVFATILREKRNFFAKRARLFQTASRICSGLVHVFAKISEKQIVSLQFSQKLIFSQKAVKISCHYNIFTEMVHLFHMLLKSFSFFLKN
jgi:hypothetical protein